MDNSLFVQGRHGRHKWWSPRASGLRAVLSAAILLAPLTAGAPSVQAKGLPHFQGLALDARGNVYTEQPVFGGGMEIEKHSGDGSQSRAVAGKWPPLAPDGKRFLGSFSGDGGPAIKAGMDSPAGLAIDAQGDLYVADSLNQRVRKVTPSGLIFTVAGSGGVLPADGHESRLFRRAIIRGADSGDGGLAVRARLNHPTGLAVDAAGNLYIADTGNGRIRKVTPQGLITTVAGIGYPGAQRWVPEFAYINGGFSGDGGPATRARLRLPMGLAVDARGNLYIADSGNNRIRRVDTRGIITTVAGSGFKGRNGFGDFAGDGGPAVAAHLNGPTGVTVDAAGNLFIADNGNGRVRKVSPDGRISTVLELAESGPEDLAIDGRGALVVVDSSGRALVTVPAGTTALPSR